MADLVAAGVTSLPDAMGLTIGQITLLHAARQRVTLGDRADFVSDVVCSVVGAISEQGWDAMKSRVELLRTAAKGEVPAELDSEGPGDRAGLITL